MEPTKEFWKKQLDLQFKYLNEKVLSPFNYSKERAEQLDSAVKQLLYFKSKFERSELIEILEKPIRTNNVSLEARLKTFFRPADDRARYDIYGNEEMRFPFARPLKERTSGHYFNYEKLDFLEKAALALKKAVDLGETLIDNEGNEVNKSLDSNNGYYKFWFKGVRFPSAMVWDQTEITMSKTTGWKIKIEPAPEPEKPWFTIDDDCRVTVSWGHFYPIHKKENDATGKGNLEFANLVRSKDPDTVVFIAGPPYTAADLEFKDLYDRKEVSKDGILYRVKKEVFGWIGFETESERMEFYQKAVLGESSAYMCTEAQLRALKGFMISGYKSIKKDPKIKTPKSTVTAEMMNEWAKEAELKNAIRNATVVSRDAIATDWGKTRLEDVPVDWMPKPGQPFWIIRSGEIQGYVISEKGLLNNTLAYFQHPRCFPTKYLAEAYYSTLTKPS